jgi:hypothetical protein
MAKPNVPSPRIPRNPSHRDPERHRRAYEEAEQLWPTHLRKHLLRAEALEAAEHPLREVA